MKYDEIDELRTHHPAWALLRSHNVALVLSFLGRVFVDRNAGDAAASALASELDEELYALNQRLGEDRFPKPASAYLDDWASPDRGWLRKFYPPGSDEARYDVAPAVEKALRWVDDLRTREFIGTESRLNTIFELLRQMVFGADDDPERRLVELRRRRAEIDEEIARAERGEVMVLDPVSQRDRYQQFSRTARELLSDFREVEENFRRLDRNLRQQIAGWTGPRAPSSTRRWGAATASPSPTRAAASRRSTTSCCPTSARPSSPICSSGYRRSTTSPTRTIAWPASISTGSTPASGPRPRSGCCPSSCAASSTTRCGWRTGGCSTCCAASRPRP